MNEAANAEGAVAPAESEPAVEEVQQPVEAKTPTEPVGDAEPSGEETPKPEEPKKNAVQERISQLTNRAKEAEKKVQELEAQARAAQPESPPEPEPMPTLEQFGYDPSQFQQAYAEWSAKQTQSQVADVMAQQLQFQAQRAREQARQEAQSAYLARQEAFVSETPDFMQKVQGVQWQSPSIAEAIVTSDNGPALAYHLASNPAVLQSVQSLPPSMQYMELGKMAAQLSAPPPVVTSTAPVPSTPVKPSGTTQKDPDKMTPDEYRKWRDNGGG